MKGTLDGDNIDHLTCLRRMRAWGEGTLLGVVHVDVWTTLGRHSLKIIINNIIIIDY
jgi:hypothetical protein